MVVEGIVKEIWPDLEAGEWNAQPLPSQLNKVWRVSFGNENYVVKSYGKLSLALHCFEREKQTAGFAVSLNMTAPVFHHDRIFVQKWVERKGEGNIEQMLGLLARFHESRAKFPDQRIPKEMAWQYLMLGQDDQMEEKFHVLVDLWDILNGNKVELVPSHCDPIIGNFIAHSEGLYLIDWEYAGMAEPYWDLAILADSVNLPVKDETLYLENYRKAAKCRPPLSRYRFHLYRIALRFVAGCWASAALRHGHRSRETLAARQSALDLIS